VDSELGQALLGKFSSERKIPLLHQVQRVASVSMGGCDRWLICLRLARVQDAVSTVLFTYIRQRDLLCMHELWVLLICSRALRTILVDMHGA
jgi:hypothetical protein